MIGFTVVCVSVLSVGGYLQGSKARKTNESIELGNRYLTELNYEQAIVSYRNALDIDPKNIEAGMGLAEAYESNRMYTYAEATYKDLLKTTKDQSDIYYKLANLYITQGKYEEAGALLDRAVKEMNDEDIKQLYVDAHPSMPTMNYTSGTYQERIKIEISADNPRQTIYYTLDGTIPDTEAQVYDRPIVLPNGETDIKAIVVNSLGFQSDILENQYNIAIRDEVIEVSEPIIEEIIRKKMGIPYGEAIYNDDIERITELYIIGEIVSEGEDLHNVFFEADTYTVDGYHYMSGAQPVLHSLQDLEMMPFLEKVVVAYQPDIDIRGLASHKYLKDLSLVGNHLTSQDIWVLSGLEELQILNLGWNMISDIKAVINIKKLKSLGLWGNQIENIQGVENLALLEYLDVSDNEIADITPVEKLGNLQQLWLYSNRIEDISSVTNLSKLNVLMIYDNPIKNMEQIRSIYPRLKRIDVDALNLKDKES